MHRTTVYDSEDPNLPKLPHSVLSYEDEQRETEIVAEMIASGGSNEYYNEYYLNGFLDSSSSEDEDKSRAHRRTLSNISAIIATSLTESKRKRHTISEGSHIPPVDRRARMQAMALDLRPKNSHDISPRTSFHQRRKSGNNNSDLTKTISYKSNNEESDLNKSASGKSDLLHKQQRRFSTAVGGLAAERRQTGWEQGIDIKTTDLIMNSIGSAVTIVDYSPTRYKIVQTEIEPGEDGSALKEMLQSKPDWSRVRWINVNGLSWEAISIIAEMYNIHRLAIEDMVDIPQRTKVDKYPTHTFCCFPLHKLITYRAKQYRKRNALFKLWHTIKPSSAREEPADQLRNMSCATETFEFELEDQQQKNLDYSISEMLAKTELNTIYQWNSPTSTHNSRSMYLDSRRPLAAKRRAVGVEQVSLFFTNQNTVISFFEHSAADIEKPLLLRISTESTILRESCDSSILFQSVIDAVVDLIHPVICAYRSRLDELEIDAVMNPSMMHTQDLHLINVELTLLRNTIFPITSIINSLREQKNTARRLAVDGEDEVPSSSTPTSAYSTKSASEYGSTISELAGVYLADVSDHALTYTQDLDIMRNNA